MPQFFVGRQPLFDRRSNTIGYELLFRSNATVDSAVFVDGDAATARVLLNAVTEIGLDHLVGDRLAFVNLTGQYFADPELIMCVSPDRVVLEVLEGVEPTEDVVVGLQRLVALGYTIALDDFVAGGVTSPLLELATIVKYDRTQMTPEAMAEGIERDHAAGRHSLVERVETHEQHAAAKAMGADYFQGYFFARPATVGVVGIAPSRLALVRLLASVNDPDATLHDIVEVLSQDVSMSVKVLKFVNAAASGLRVDVESIHQAAVLVGRDQLRNWTNLALMATIDDKPIELVAMALTRAKFCELIGRQGRIDQPDTLYTVGMLSLLDAMTDTDMESIVESLTISDRVRSALLGEDGPLTDVLRHAHALEQRFDGGGPAISNVELEAHREAVRWATQLMSTAGAMFGAAGRSSSDRRIPVRTDARRPAVDPERSRRPSVRAR